MRCGYQVLLLLLLSPSLVLGQDPASVDSLAARTVLRQFCVRCHSGPGSEGGEFDALNQATLLKKDSSDNPLVLPGKPGESALIQRIIEQEMPPSGQPQPRPEDIAILWSWVKSGAAAFPAIEAREPVSILQVMTAIRNDVRDIPLEDQSYQRYFTLHYLANNPQQSDDDLRLQRAALSKALNSLSWKKRIVVPRPVDKAQLVFAIDIRSLDWEKKDRWQQLIRDYPYGAHFTGSSDATAKTLRDLDIEIRKYTHSELPVLRGDWFVANATRPPLYYKLLDLPNDARTLEQQLEVDIADRFMSPTPDRIARAAFDKSGVSGQNRLLERLESKHGAYWKSYDFKANSPHNRLRRFPLGPANLFPPGKHPFPNQAFEHDGGEIIFNLPNGLQAYYLIDGKEGRIDEGPIEVVSDPLKTSGTPAIVNGVSCMACHKLGIISFKDYIRGNSAVFGAAEEQVERLYIDQKLMDDYVAEDSRRFQSALDAATGIFLRTGPTDKRPISDFPEPVGEMSRQYRLGFLDQAAAARELDLAGPEELLTRVGVKKLKQLGLENLIKPGGVIARLEWESTTGVSLMQEVARELGRTPLRIF